MDEVIKTVAWVVVFVTAINGAVVYAIVRLLTTGRAMFERRERDRDNERSGGLVRMSER